MARTTDPAPAVPAATVVLLRDGAAGPETLMLRRNETLTAHAGLWVFPGGRLEPEDAAAGDADDLAGARRAAAREAQEEAGLRVDAATLVPFAHWCPPDTIPFRFATWFFVAPAHEGTVEIDNGEILESRWLRPADALALHERRELELITPTWVTLHDLAACPSVGDVLAWARSTTPFLYESRIVPYDEGRVALFPGDAGWRERDKDRAGSRHRLWMPATPPWRLERDTPARPASA
jgi:8-oxo-dGTP pyrophosphatase MutT (NUDIX family)